MQRQDVHPAASKAGVRPLLLLLLVLLAGLLAVPATADDVPDGYEYSDAWSRSTDGTQLHAGGFLPADREPGERHPVLLVSTPYTAPNGGASDLRERRA